MMFSVLILSKERNVCDANMNTKTEAQLILNYSLLANLQNNLTGKWPMTQTFRATPLIRNYDPL
jgi:hypothetical protein